MAQGDLGQQVAVRSQDELGDLANAFNQMSHDLAQATEARRQMTADVAHDLRTPLTVLMGYTEPLQEGKLKGTPELYAVMHDEVLHLKHLIEDLRTLSLADAGELRLYRRPVDTKALLERTGLAFMALAEQKGVRLHVEAADNLPLLNVDVERTTQLLKNLVSNALRHTPAGGEIVLSAEFDAAAHRIHLAVQDTGVGIAPDALPHIFDRFYRADKSRERTEGESGLGLAIAKSIVRAHGGTIKAESAPEEGTTFTISLPPAGGNHAVK
jgi:signal transduction histidine kinase